MRLSSVPDFFWNTLNEVAHCTGGHDTSMEPEEAGSAATCPTETELTPGERVLNATILLSRPSSPGYSGCTFRL